MTDFWYEPETGLWIGPPRFGQDPTKSCTALTRNPYTKHGTVADGDLASV